MSCTNKRILLIDDEIVQMDTIKKRCSRSTLVAYASSIYEYFEPTDSGKFVEVIKPIDAFEFIFIHKSIKDKNIPETLFSAIRDKIGVNKLFCFSGGNSDSIREGLFSRQTVYANFFRFVDFNLKY